MRSNKFLRILINFVSVFVLMNMNTPVYGQVYEMWNTFYDGPVHGSDSAGDMIIDSFGNVYITGTSESAGTGWDIVTVKFDSNGALVWATRYDGPAHHDDQGSALIFNSTGQLVMTGFSKGIGTDTDFITVGYDAETGSELWAARYNGTGSREDFPKAITADSTGNVYVTGSSTRIGGAFAATTISYDRRGSVRWISHFDTPGGGEAMGIDIGAGNLDRVYVTCANNPFLSDEDIVTLAYDMATGARLWVEFYDGVLHDNDSPKAMTVSKNDYIYVTGFTVISSVQTDIVTIAYDSAGSRLWVSQYDGPLSLMDSPRDIVVDGKGFTYITGMGDGDSTKTSNVVTLAYDSTGMMLWSHQYPDPRLDTGLQIMIGREGYLYVLGNMTNVRDMNGDWCILYYSATGLLVWKKIYNDRAPVENFEVAASIALGAKESLIVGGTRRIAGQWNIVAVKYGQGSPPVPMHRSEWLFIIPVIFSCFLLLPFRPPHT